MMSRTAIYARFSSDRQSERSAEDQARICAARAGREGWQIIETFADLAISGATRNRPGLNALLGRLNEFDIVLAEALDRISRDQEDIAAIYKRLRFAGVKLVTLSEGEIGEIHIGLKGTMAALFLKELGEKTRRGQIGRVAAGRIPGGRSYGYQLDVSVGLRGDVERGRRRIDEDQGAIVRRIFREFLAGRSPRAIAAALNAEGVASPSGRQWNASTINGSRTRRNGILHNELYAGRIVYDRQRFERDPVTRKRVSRPNPRSEWKVQEAPELRIVDEATWAATVEKLDRLGGLRPDQRRRPKRLLSGLLSCGVCGGSYTIIGSESWGCSARRESGTCTNGRTIMTKPLERRVIGALRDKLLAPDVVKAFVAEFHKEMERDRQQKIGNRRMIERKHAEASQRLARMAEAIADGASSFADIRALMTRVSAERDRLALELAEIDAAPVVALHPAIADSYAAAIDRLSEALESQDGNREEARDAMRSIIDQLILTPNEAGRGVKIEVRGRLAEILHIAQGRPPRGNRPDHMVVMVAGTGFEPVTFRL
ncbi:recombinase family protein [Sphingomonas oryzagri]